MDLIRRRENTFEARCEERCKEACFCLLEGSDQMQYDYWSRISRSMVLINDIRSGVFHSASDVCERAVLLGRKVLHLAKEALWCLYSTSRIRMRRGLQLFYLQMCTKHDTRVRDNIKHKLFTNLLFTYFSSYMWFSTTAPLLILSLGISCWLFCILLLMVRIVIRCCWV